MARGSLLELETQLEIARELGIGNSDELGKSTSIVTKFSVFSIGY
jgi:hypothetical protein